MTTSKASFSSENQNDTDKVNRQNGYYWVMHDYMWFLTLYNYTEDVFYFPGQYIGFAPQHLQEIDERRIEREVSG